MNRYNKTFDLLVMAVTAQRSGHTDVASALLETASKSPDAQAAITAMKATNKELARKAKASRRSRRATASELDPDLEPLLPGEDMRIEVESSAEDDEAFDPEKTFSRALRAARKAAIAADEGDDDEKDDDKDEDEDDDEKESKEEASVARFQRMMANIGNSLERSRKARTAK